MNEPIDQPDLTPTAPDSAHAALPIHARWWTYQRERFPLLGHGALIAAFSFCAVSLSRTLRGAAGWPTATQLIVAFGTCFTFFLQLRIADEFKDYAEDLQYRPYRPVQRGVVSLRELRLIFVIGAAVQLLLATWLNAKLIFLLLMTWSYLALMSQEFFAADWLRPRATLYMLSHMLILPLVDLYATSSDWLPLQPAPPRGLGWFLAASYCNGMVIEIGRKIRQPEAEEIGVTTYSRLWGRGGAVTAWWLAQAATFGFAVMVGFETGCGFWIISVLAVALCGSILVGRLFLVHPRKGSGKWIETASGLWTLLLYLSLGLLPHLAKVVAREMDLHRS